MCYKMTKSDHYYFSDSIFQLELNLHNIRRELILMIEEFEKNDCFSCLQLKCRCLLKSPEKNNTTTSHEDSGKKWKEGTPKAPPVDALPQSNFKKEVEGLTKTEGNKDIEAWIEASGAKQKATDLQTDVILATLRKSWADPRNDLKKDIILGDLKKERFILDPRIAAANAVEVFFNSFKMQPAVKAGSLAYGTNVAAIGNYKYKSSEYSYF